jgi:hypothetical protein
LKPRSAAAQGQANAGRAGSARRGIARYTAEQQLETDESMDTHDLAQPFVQDDGHAIGVSASIFCIIR